MIEMRFFVRIRGAFTPPPRIDVPVMKMPLHDRRGSAMPENTLAHPSMYTDTPKRQDGRAIRSSLTMRHPRPIDLYKDRYRDLPIRMETLSRGIARPVVA
ncbi:hypothetical protein CLAIMM_14300 [Cladophialophora immunda]|nr:hypothetical protein CLAIMM_14300 [Cladophialophora immunda]